MLHATCCCATPIPSPWSPRDVGCRSWRRDGPQTQPAGRQQCVGTGYTRCGPAATRGRRTEGPSRLQQRLMEEMCRTAQLLPAHPSLPKHPCTHRTRAQTFHVAECEEQRVQVGCRLLGLLEDLLLPLKPGAQQHSLEDEKKTTAGHLLSRRAALLSPRRESRWTPSRLRGEGGKRAGRDSYQ